MVLSNEIKMNCIQVVVSQFKLVFGNIIANCR